MPHKAKRGVVKGLIQQQGDRKRGPPGAGAASAACSAAASAACAAACSAARFLPPAQRHADGTAAASPWRFWCSSLTAHGAHALHAVGCDGLAALFAQGLGQLMDADRPKGGELAQFQSVQSVAGTGGDTDATFAALPRGDHDPGLTVRQILTFQRACPAGRSHRSQP